MVYTESTGIGFSSDCLFGYVGGQKFEITNSIEQICAFIMKYKNESEILITSVLDTPEIRVTGGFVDFCMDQSSLPRLLDRLIPMQLGNAEVPEYVPRMDRG